MKQHRCPQPAGARSGVAIVMVLVVMLALLLLGLPFLASQSASRAGARQWSQEANALLSRDAAEGEGIATAIGLLPDHLARAHNLPSQLGRIDVLGENRFRVRLPQMLDPGAAHGARAATVIEDESGKLDPNTMGAETWAGLLEAVGITDFKNDWTWVWSDPANGSLPQPGQWRQRASPGQLAVTLSRCGLYIPETGYRVTDIDQLLRCDPARFRNSFASANPDPYSNRPTPSAAQVSSLLRLSLTAAELSLLRPYLSVAVPGTGRGGFVDGGTVIHYDAATDQYVFDERADQILIPDAILVGERGNVINDRLPERGSAWNSGVIANGRPLARAGQAIGLTVPLAVNPNHAAQPVLQAIGRSITANAAQLSDISVFERTNPQWLRNAGGTTTGIGRMHASEHIQPPAVVTIESFASGQDAALRRTAGDGRRTIVQVLDQERGVRREWSTQADWQAHIHNLFAPRTVSGPKAYARNLDVRQTDGALSDTGYTISQALPGLLRTAPFAADWLVGCGDIDAQMEADILRPQTNDDRVPGYPKPTIEVDGIKPGGIIPYQLHATEQQGHLLTPRSARGGNSHDSELAARWISLQVKFTNPGSAVSLLCARAPKGSTTLGDEAGGTPGSNESQHRFELVYDPAGPGGSMLRLYIANGAIPHTRDEPGMMGWDDATTPQFDEAALGSGHRTSGPFAPSDPAKVCELRTRFTPVKDRWYNILVSVVNDQPNGSAILIDGVGGRSWLASGAFDRQGDWYHFPQARLETALPAIDPQTTANALQVQGDTLTVSVPPGVDIDDVLPTRGQIRIHDEYIAYGERSGTTLRKLRRSVRVNTNRASPTIARQWQQTQAHSVGSGVAPGWFTYQTTVQNWHLGAATLQQELGAGDTATSYAQPHLAAQWRTTPLQFPGTYETDATITQNIIVSHLRYRTWAWLDRTQFITASAAIRVEQRPTLRLADARGLWPKQGQVRFFRCLSASSAASEIGNAWFTSSGGTPTTITLPGVGASATMAMVPTSGEAVFCVVTSVAVDQADDFPNQSSWFQVASDDGRVEWLQYQRFETPGVVPGTYATHTLGFPFLPLNTLTTSRGSMRTAFAGRSELSAKVPPPFAQGSKVLPVQAMPLGIAIQAYGLESGDVLTLMPMGRWSSSTKPVQVVVRYAATDGYPTTPISTPGSDSYNFLFALNDQVPKNAPTGYCAFMVGRGWVGSTSMNEANNWTLARVGTMPRIEAMANDFTNTGDARNDARVTLGPDSERGSVGDVTSLRFDCSGSGAMPVDGNRVGGLGIAAVRTEASGPALPRLSASLQPGFELESVVPMFTLDYGLLWVNGEIMAYKRRDTTHGVIIGRGLLGTAAIDHEFARISNGNLGGLLIAWPMPWAGVGVLPDGLPAPSSAPQRIDVVGSRAVSAIQAQSNMSWVVTDPLGQQVESVRLYRVTNGRGTGGRLNIDYYDAPWLRGMYGTTARSWPASSQDGQQTLIIAWNPRHAPALPKTLPSDASVLSALLRSRRHQSLGIALNRHGMRVDMPATSHSFEVDQAPLSFGLRAHTEVRGLAIAKGSPVKDWFDWANKGLLLPLSGNGAWIGYQGVEVDGVEWRIHAQYDRDGASTGHQAWLDLAEAAAVQLKVTKAKASAAAPIRILSSESQQ